jgi:hypothetical protein
MSTSLFTPFAEAMRDIYAKPKPTLKVGIHPIGSTVSEETLNRYGYSATTIPADDIYAGRSYDDNMEPLAS